MLKLPASNRRTDPELESQVVALIARGDRYASICEETGVPVPTIKKIKRRNLDAIAEIEREITEWQVQVAAKMLQKTYTLLERKLDKALAGEEDIQLRELVALSKEMHKQAQAQAEGQGTPMSPVVSKAELDTLLHAIKTSDEVELQRIIFSNTGTRQS